MNRQTMLLVPFLAAASLAGCAVRAAYVAVPPPPARVEVFGVAPGPGYVWCDGYWNWVGSRYVWVQGYWGRPPHRGARWEPARWENRHVHYEFERGHWR